MSVLYQWLWRLIPANPMAVRIVHGGSRQPRHHWVRMGYLGALIALVLLGLFSGGGLAESVSLTELAKAGTWVFAVIAYGQVILVCLLAPLFMAGAIGSEQQGQTYNILLTTPLSNLQIVLGSLLGRLFFVWALLLSGLPLFAVLLIFGGVPIASVGVAFAVAGLTALVVGTVAVTMSVMRVGGRKAVFSFVIAVAGYLVAAYALDGVLLRRLTAQAGTTTWLTPLHPLLVLESSLNRANYAPVDPAALADAAWIVRVWLTRPLGVFVGLSLTLSGVGVVASAVVLRRVGQGEWAGAAWLRRRLRLGRTARVRPPREVWANPIAWREANTRGKFASGIVARYGFTIVAVLGAAAVLGVYHLGGLPDVPGPTGRPLPQADLLRAVLLTAVLLELAVITLVALYMSAGSVSREREDGTLDLMLTTPITPRFYIWGKLRGLVSFLSMLIAAPVLTVAMVSGYAWVGQLAGWEQATYQVTIGIPGGTIVREPPLLLPEAPLLLAAILVPFVALCAAVGMSWSLKARGVLGAVVPSIAVMGAVVGVLGLCGWQAAETIPLLGPVINAFSPATAVTMLVDPWQRVGGFAEAPPFGRMSLLLGAATAAAGYSAIVYALIVGMVRGFDHTVRRLSGDR